jgi:zinc/manganese transport system permease protein
MSEAYGLLIEPFASFGFMRTALVACMALALANGPIGTLLLLRRMSLEGDVLSHAVMPGAARGFSRNARRQASPRSISSRWRWA